MYNILPNLWCQFGFWELKLSSFIDISPPLKGLSEEVVCFDVWQDADSDWKIKSASNRHSDDGRIICSSMSMYTIPVKMLSFSKPKFQTPSVKSFLLAMPNTDTLMTGRNAKDGFIFEKELYEGPIATCLCTTAI